MNGRNESLSHKIVGISLFYCCFFFFFLFLFCFPLFLKHSELYPSLNLDRLFLIHPPEYWADGHRPHSLSFSLLISFHSCLPFLYSSYHMVLNYSRPGQS